MTEMGKTLSLLFVTNAKILHVDQSQVTHRADAATAIVLLLFDQGLRGAYEEIIRRSRNSVRRDKVLEIYQSTRNWLLSCTLTSFRSGSTPSS